MTVDVICVDITLSGPLAGAICRKISINLKNYHKPSSGICMIRLATGPFPIVTADTVHLYV